MSDKETDIRNKVPKLASYINEDNTNEFNKLNDLYLCSIIKNRYKNDPSYLYVCKPEKDAGNFEEIIHKRTMNTICPERYIFGTLRKTNPHELSSKQQVEILHDVRVAFENAEKKD